MESSSNDYRISFFKPTTPQATANRNMVVWLVLIWFVAIFGFQILLRLIEKPTPEPDYIAFQNVWEDVQQSSATDNDLQTFGKSVLSVLGKVNITIEERNILDDALSWTVFKLYPEPLTTELVAQVEEFKEIQASITSISDPAYIEAKKSLSADISPKLSLPMADIRSKILPLELTSDNMNELTNNTKEQLPAIMEKYLVHNQSFLTEARFLGFPFHYFYTAVFLLILFVGLCWLYCVKTDQLNAKFNIVD